MPNDRNTGLNSHRFVADSAASCEIPGSRWIADAPLLRWPQQHTSCLVQVDQPAGHKQPVGVLIQSAVTHLGKTEESFEYQKRMFGFRAHLGFGPVLGPFFVRQGVSSPVK